jgi:hypothetical protein
MNGALTQPGLDTAWAARSRRRLALTALLVVLAHAWLLQRAPDLVQPGLPASESLIIRPMQTRQIVMSPQPAARASDALGARTLPVPAAQPMAAARPSAIHLHSPDASPPGAPSPQVLTSQLPAPPPVTAEGAAREMTPALPVPTPAPAPAPASASVPASAIAPAAATVPAAGTATPPLAIPGSVSLRYIVSATSRGRPYQVNGTLQWQHDGERYQARLEISAFLLGARVQTSVGRITEEGLAPTRFGDRARSEQATHFQRDKGIISFSNNAPDAPLQAGAQDRLSAIVQLGAMLAGAPQRYPAGTVVSLQTAGVREAEVWQFSVVGPERLELPGGALEAIKLLRTPRREFDQTIELWLAPTIQYLPVRVRITQGNGDVADQQWLSGGMP